MILYITWAWRPFLYDIVLGMIDVGYTAIAAGVFFFTNVLIHVALLTFLDPLMILY